MEYWAQFIFLYPVLMSIIWMVGAIYFYWRYERTSPKEPPLKEFPLVSVMIPAHNEEKSIEETINELLKCDYPDFEIIVISDGSTDRTNEIILRLTEIHPKVRSLILKKNLGKANALNMGLLMTAGEYIVTIDADCLLEPKALHWLVFHLITQPRVGAVTGNPRVRNRTSLLAKIQTAEYASVIGLIKRSQRLLGKILTVSGVIAAFRKRAIIDAGLWSPDMITDDIDLTWKLEQRFWSVYYELNAVGWILVPETLGGLWRQRVRWAQGGIEVIHRYWNICLDWRMRRMWPLYIDYILSVFWACSFLLFSFLWLSELIFPIPYDFFKLSPIPSWTGTIVALVCLVQFGVSLLLDRKYDPTILKYYFWVIWYPVIYWVYNALAVIWALPKALFKKKGTRAVWVSPDRGMHTSRKHIGDRYYEHYQQTRIKVLASKNN
ncbi:poly-beta-1,6-N-acetyl-D-glucosamine synthase [Dendrosporobacter sp. 1207_IL3150]|uniref:poly-beta-1,6-N-acetyl-D-glucosamine synthase n=1 Tax=Dendrosporobacter sp. 1207_IL3150 TaxID=3084054 RepID=UPI002FD93073